MKKLIIIISVALLALLAYRITFCYRIVPLSNTGDKKHKIYGVFYFPSFVSASVNPCMTNSLESKIKEFADSPEYDHSTQTLSTKVDPATLDYFKSFKTNIQAENFKIESIKFENNSYHILVGKKDDLESTIVFILDPNSNNIVSYY